MSFTQQYFSKISTPGVGVIDNWFYKYPVRTEQRKFYTLYIHSLYVEGAHPEKLLGPLFIFSNQVNMESTYLADPDRQLLFYGTLNQASSAINTFENGYVRFVGNPEKIDFNVFVFDSNLQKPVALGHGGLINYTLEMTVV